jgi:hypothetical protein
MNPAVIVLVDFLTENLLCLPDIRHILSDTGANKPILEPLIRTFNFSFRLRRECIDDFDIAIVQYLFPLWICFIGQKVVFPSERVSALDKSKDGMRIHIIGKGDSVFQHERFQRKNVRPGCFSFEQLGIKNKTAEIVKRSDEMPLFTGLGRP